MSMSLPLPRRSRGVVTAAGLGGVSLQPPVLLCEALALLRQTNRVGVLGALSGGGPPVQDCAAVLRPEQVGRRPDHGAQLMPANLPRLSERQAPATILESLQVKVGDPAELRHP